MKATIQNILTTCLLLSTLYSCSPDQPSILNAPKIDEAALRETRAVKKKVAAEAYYYRTLASFVNGSLTLTIMDEPEYNVQQVNLVVLYEASAPWAELLDAGLPQVTGNNNLNDLLQSYDLQIVKQFTIDRNNKGLVLESSEKLYDPVETARRLSLIEHVLMVNIKEIPSNTILSINQKDK